MNQNASNEMREFAIRYTAAWCSHDAVGVAAFFSPDGSLRDNDGPVLIGRRAITESAQTFMTTFPDLKLLLDDIVGMNGKFIYKWTLEGTHCTTGRRVRIVGSEEWTMGEDGLVAESMGSFDGDDYHRQVGQ
jgi:uncharacterized protein (TIGR02246 family)